MYVLVMHNAQTTRLMSLSQPVSECNSCRMSDALKVDISEYPFFIQHYFCTDAAAAAAVLFLFIYFYFMLVFSPAPWQSISGQ